MDSEAPDRAPRVLIADDDEDIRTLVRFMLEVAGFEVTEAADGAEALRLAACCRPDVVVLDGWMPVQDGWECLADLKADPRFRAVPVVMCTANGEAGHRNLAMGLGAADYITKPFDPESLVRQVQDVLASAVPVARSA